MSREKLVFVLISMILAAGCSTGTPPPAPVQPPAPTVRATPAAFNSAPTTQPLLAPAPAASGNLATEFDAELLRLLNNEPQPAGSSAASLPADERQLIATVIESLSQFRSALRDNSGMMATRVEPLLELSDRIREQAPLNLPTLAICRKVTQFGAYEEFEPARFSAGKETPTIIYCEVENFASKMNIESDRWETKLNYEAVLYSGDNDHSTPIVSKKPATVVDECRIRRRDFFLADRLTLPANLPAGQYILKVTVIDQLANHVAEKTVPIAIEAH